MNEIKINEILELYENDIKKKVKNKNSLLNFEKNKMQNVLEVINSLSNSNYQIKKYNIFLVKEPKYRIVMSLGINDKIINHYVAKNILIPKLEHHLDFRNVATRKNMGTDFGIKLIKKFIEKNKKYGNFYVLKLDISKYFYNIDHEVLKSMLINELERDEFNLVSNIIDSSNAPYINKVITKYKEKGIDVPYYQTGKGLPIGNMTSQFLSIFYLNELDHFIIHKLHLKYYVRYMDDFVIFHHDKNYLKKCLKIIIDKLDRNYKLKVNQKKTIIFSIKEGLSFLGYNFKVINNKTIIKVRKETFIKLKTKVKELNYLYDNNLIPLDTYFASISNYLNTYKYSKKKIRAIIMKNF